jgi:signal peptidase II
VTSERLATPPNEIAAAEAHPAHERVPATSLAARAAVVVALVVADLWSKSAVFAWLASGVPFAECHRHGTPRYTIFGDWFAFMLSRNPGMAWGFNKLPPWLLVGGRIAAVAFLAWLVARTPKTRRVLVVALVLVLAGAVGNLYDNLFLAREGETFGQVRDFVDVYFTAWDWHFPTFNVADSCISVGAVLLFVSSFAKSTPSDARVTGIAAR